jgi:hypothetical protein
VLAPFAFDMFERAPKGSTMLSDFQPFMTESRLAGFKADIASIDAAVRELHPTPQARRAEAFRALDEQWPQIHHTMSTLLDSVHDNLPNYQAVAALPDFSLFPWFFVIPGVLTAGLAGFALRRPDSRAPRVALGVLGVGLVLAPVVFQMFTRAPKGAEMMSAFETIETNANVTRIQSYFATIAGGQGAIRLEIVPALERGGTDVAERFPAANTLDEQWVHVLNDVTPMIGAMSDNVDNYQAIAALPDFRLFPWFFVAPGLLIAGAALASRPRKA